MRRYLATQGPAGSSRYVLMEKVLARLACQEYIHRRSTEHSENIEGRGFCVSYTRPRSHNHKVKNRGNHDALDRPIFLHSSLRPKWSCRRETFRRASPTHPGCTPWTAKFRRHRLGDENEVSAGTPPSLALAASPSSPRPGRARGRSSETAGRPLRHPKVLGARGGGATGSATCTYVARGQGTELGFFA